jgi:hypothetical protein
VYAVGIIIANTEHKRDQFATSYFVGTGVACGLAARPVT